MFLDMCHGKTIVFWTRYCGNTMFLDMYYGNTIVLWGQYHVFGHMSWQHYSSLGVIPCLYTFTMGIL